MGLAIQGRPLRPRVGGALIGALAKQIIEGNAPTELVSVERMIGDSLRSLVVEKSPLHRDKLGGGEQEAGLRPASSQSAFHRHKVGGDDVADKWMVSRRVCLLTPISNFKCEI